MIEKMQDQFTKYEIARILGARALQLAMDAPILLKINEEKLDEINYDVLKLAELEFQGGVLPITVKRPFPKKKEEKKKKLSKEEAEKIEEEKQEKIEEEKKEEEQEKIEDKEIDKKKKIEEAKIREGGEIMELARPQDEIEDSGKREEGAV